MYKFIKKLNKFYYKGNNTFDYITCCIAILASGIASGFIQAFVYNVLAHNNLPALYFTSAFAIAIIFGFFGVKVGYKILYFNSKKIKLFLFFLQIVTLISIIIIVNSVGFSYKIVLICEGLTSIVASSMFPLFQKVTRKIFKDTNISVASKVDVYIYGANIIFGLGLGSVLLNVLQSDIYSLIIIILYVISALFIMFLKGDYTENNENKRAGKKDFLKKFSSLNGYQKLSFLIMPVLIIVGTPATSLVPVIYENISIDYLSLLILFF